MIKLYFYIFSFLVITFFGCSKKVVPTNTVSVTLDDSSTESELEYQYTFTEANKQLLFGNIKQAALLFNKCIELDSSRSMPYYQLSNIYYRAGDAKSALGYAESAYQHENSNIWINKLLIELYRLNDKLDDAIEVTENLSANNSSLELEFTLASLYHDSGKDKKALDILNSIENSYGVSEEVSLSKHEILAEQGKEKEAEDELLKLIELNPEEYRFQGMLAEFYSNIGQNDKAEQIYTNLLKKNSGNPFIILSAAEHYRNVKNVEEAKKLYSLALTDEAFDLNNKIRTIIGLISNQEFFSTQNEYIGNLIDSLIDIEGEENIKLLTLRADYSIRVNNFDSAEKDLIKILDLDKDNLIIWEQLLYINNRQNDNETLLEYSEKALKYFPDQANFYLFKGLAEMNMSYYDKSVSSFKNGLKLTQDNDPLEIQFLTFLGDVYRNLGNNKKSDEYFEKVLEKDPDNMIVLNNYSYYLSLRDEKLDLAEKYSKKTVEREPNNSTYLDTYAWVLYKLRKYENARKYIEKAIENNGSSNSEILDHYGDILVKMKDYSNAVKYWRLAIENGGESESIKEKISSVLPLVDEE